MSTFIPTEYLDQLSLSQLIVTHMHNHLEENQIATAQELFLAQVQQGEQDLRKIYAQLGKKQLRQPEVQAGHNYYDYLRCIWNLRPANLEQLVAGLEEGRKKGLLNIYPNINWKKIATKKTGGFEQFLQEEKLPIEVAYSGNSVATSKLIGVVVRRKDTDRALEKIAYRLLRQMIEDTKPEEERVQYNALIGDWFGLKLVAPTREQAYKLFQQIYPHLYSWQLKPDVREDLGKNKRPQQPGVDDHYLFGRGYDQLIQIKVMGIYDFSHTRKEICLTDIANFLIDEMDHIKFRQSQKAEMDEFLDQRMDKRLRDLFEKLYEIKCTKNRDGYNIFIGRGNEIAALLPETRQRILVPGEDF